MEELFFHLFIQLIDHFDFFQPADAIAATVFLNSSRNGILNLIQIELTPIIGETYHFTSTPNLRGSCGITAILQNIEVIEEVNLKTW